MERAPIFSITLTVLVMLVLGQDFVSRKIFPNQQVPKFQERIFTIRGGLFFLAAGVLGSPSDLVIWKKEVWVTEPQRAGLCLPQSNPGAASQGREAVGRCT